MWCQGSCEILELPISFCLVLRVSHIPSSIIVFCCVLSSFICSITELHPWPTLKLFYFKSQKASELYCLYDCAVICSQLLVHHQPSSLEEVTSQVLSGSQLNKSNKNFGVQDDAHVSGFSWQRICISECQNYSIQNVTICDIKTHRNALIPEMAQYTREMGMENM